MVGCFVARVAPKRFIVGREQEAYCCSPRQRCTGYGRVPWPHHMYTPPHAAHQSPVPPGTQAPEALGEVAAMLEAGPAGGSGGPAPQTAVMLRVLRQWAGEQGIDLQ